MEDITYQIHWLSFTVHAPAQAAFDLYNEIFQKHLGGLDQKNHGGRGYKELFEGLFAFKMYLNPASGDKQHFHIEIPGQACEVIPWTRFQEMHDYLEMVHPESFFYRRFDFAFDHVKFSPEQVLDAIRNDQIRSLAKRKSLTVHQSPFKERENGEIGTYTVNFGSRSSGRMIRVYNARGFTRLEIEMKRDRAHVIATQVLNYYDVDKWGKIVIKHLLDYVDFFTGWWQEFISGECRANVTISKPKELALEKTVGWLEKQVTPSLSVVYDVFPEKMIKAMIDNGRKRRKSKLDALARVK